MPTSDWTKAEPDNWRFGGGAADTVLHPLVLVAMIITVTIILCKPRKYALVAFLLSTLVIPAGQQVLVGGVHVFVYRIIVAAGWIKMIGVQSSRKRHILSGGWTSIDAAFVLYVSFHVIAFIILNLEVAAVVNQVGFVWDYLGGYVFLRYLIQTEEEITRTITCLAYLVLLLALCMVHEQMSHQNIFGLLGGVRLVPEMRMERIRSQAVFQHALLAGSCGATVMPLFIWLWKTGKARCLSVIGVIAAGVMVMASACSTPIAGFCVALMGLCCWPLRKHMRILRWSVGLTLITLHFVMNAPVWALMQRIDIVQGASSYHRYVLVDQFIRHWADWWLIGTTTNATWGAFTFDSANQYVAEGTTGGLISLIFFIVVIVRCFSMIGKARKHNATHRPLSEWLVWVLGVSLFAHVIGFLGISYFDQMRVVWFSLIAMICAATGSNGKPSMIPLVNHWR